MTSIPDFVKLEMSMATLMAQQEASGFRFDRTAAERVRNELSREAENLEEKIGATYNYYPGRVFTPKRTSAKTGYVAGAPMTKLVDFNPTSRLHIHWALTTFRGARFTKVTASGKPQVDEATLSEVKDLALVAGNQQLHDECEMFIRLLTLQKHMGQLSEGANSWLNSIEEDSCIHHSCTLATQTGRNAHRGPNLGQVVSAPWARELFVPFHGHVMVGADLEGLELRALGHYLHRFDEGAFADVVCNGDIHQQNADRVGCTRTQVKTLTYAFIYGAGDQKLGHSLHPEMSDAQKKSLGSDLRRKFLDAIPGLEPLIDAVKLKVRETGKLKGLDGRPIFCDGEHKALNFLLQSCGAILSKRWVTVSQDLIDAEGFSYDRDYTRCAYVHDEQQFSVLPNEAEHFAQLLVDAAPIAGQYYKFKVPITAASDIGANWAATH
jgi:DNA polymerase I-like protein with 3'-5' exonuclease and polymerase domains